MNEDLKKLHETKNYDEIHNLVETKFSQFESRWNSVLASKEGVKLYRNTKLSDSKRDKIYRKMFAQLIVRECLEVVRQSDDECYDEWDYADRDLCGIIKEHFGVE